MFFYSKSQLLFYGIIILFYIQKINSNDNELNANFYDSSFLLSAESQFLQTEEEMRCFHPLSH